jgi:hypothetical protein
VRELGYPEFDGNFRPGTDVISSWFLATKLAPTITERCMAKYQPFMEPSLDPVLAFP